MILSFATFIILFTSGLYSLESDTLYNSSYSGKELVIQESTSLQQVYIASRNIVISIERGKTMVMSFVEIETKQFINCTIKVYNISIMFKNCTFQSTSLYAVGLEDKTKSIYFIDLTFFNEFSQDRKVLTIINYNHTLFHRCSVSLPSFVFNHNSVISLQNISIVSITNFVAENMPGNMIFIKCALILQIRSMLVSTGRKTIENSVNSVVIEIQHVYCISIRHSSFKRLFSQVLKMKHFSEIRIDNVTFNNIVSHRYGACLIRSSRNMIKDGSKIFVQNCNFISCSTIEGSAAINIISSADIVSDHIYTRGYNWESSINFVVSFRKTLFYNCSTQTSGAALYYKTASNLTPFKTPQNLLFTDCIFTSNKAMSGGCIAINNAFNVSISTCIFRHNLAKINGGTLYIKHAHAIQVQGSDFVLNIAAGQFSPSHGGAVYAQNVVEACIYHCKFISNQVAKPKIQQTFYSSGGALSFSNSKNLTIFFSLFMHNTVHGNGGVCHIEQMVSLSVVCSIFIHNKAKSYGGCIAAKQCNHICKTNSTFKNNAALDNGGVYYMDGLSRYTPTNMYTKFCQFINNTATHAGGVAYVLTLKSLTNLNCLIVNNRAKKDGGGGLFLVSVRRHMNIGCIFMRNSAFYGGAIHIMHGKGITNIKCHFMNNVAGIIGNRHRHGKGGAIEIFSINYMQNIHTMFAVNHGMNGGGGICVRISIKSLYMLSCSCINNTAEGHGGFINMLDNNHEATAALFFSNHSIYINNMVKGAPGTDAFLDGGAIYINNIYNFTNNHCTYRGNQASKAGGGMMLRNGQQVLNSHCIFVNNCGAYGGAFDLGSSAKTLNVYCQFIRNMATETGGAVSFMQFFNMQAELVNRHCLFRENVIMHSVSHDMHYNNGAAMSVATIKNLFSYNCSYISNQAKGCPAGAINVKFVSNYIEKKGYFRSNVASHGGAVKCQFISSKLTFYRCIFLRNQAFSDAGAISVHTCRNIRLVSNESVYINNTSGKSGGAIHIKDVSHIINVHCHFSNNSAKTSGGAIYSITELTSGHCKIRNMFSLFHGNVGGKGGAFYVETATVITNYRIYCSSNLATTQGGAFYITKAAKVINNNSIFKNNFAKFDGGSIYLSHVKYVANIICVFEGSVARFRNGGAYYLEHSKILLNVKSVFCKSMSQQGGALFVWSVHNISNLHVKFQGNVASKNGGAVLVMYISHFSISKCCLVNSSSTSGSGGACSLKSTDFVSLQSSVFKNNRATIGGVFHVNIAGKCRLSRNVFAQNIATEKAGVLFVNRIEEIHMNRAVLIRNRATDATGALYIASCGTIFVISSSFLNNKARSMGIIYAADFKEIISIKNHFMGNINAGVLLLNSGRKYLDYKNVYSTNEVYDRGTAINTLKIQKIMILHARISDNRAIGSGGGIIFDECDIVYITSCLFLHNKAGAGGGAVAFSKIKHFLSIFNCYFTENSGKDKGGSITLTDVFILSLLKSKFHKEVTKYIGGAIYLSCEQCQVYIQLVNFISNRAKLEAGALYVKSSKIVINKSLFAFNRAGIRGGALFVYLSSDLRTAINIDLCNFTSNTAGEEGGTMVIDGVTELGLQNSFIRDSSDTNVVILHGAVLLISNVRVQTHTVNKYIFDSSAAEIKFESSLIFRCPFYTYLEEEGTILSGFGKCSNKSRDCHGVKVKYRCATCSSGFYSSHLGFDVEAENDLAQVLTTKPKCHSCPEGGICKHGKIVAQQNYWGYRYQEVILFTKCPTGFCCPNISCLSYNSCNFRRHGLICSECNFNTSVALNSQACLPLTLCNTYLVAIYFFLSALIYTLILCFQNDLIAFLISGSKKTWHALIRTKIRSNKLEVNITVEPEDTSSGKNSKSVVVQEHETPLIEIALNNIGEHVKKTDTVHKQQNSLFDCVSDVWQIIVYHLQDSQLFHVGLPDVKHESILYTATGYIATICRISAIYTEDMCVPRMNSISKQLLQVAIIPSTLLCLSFIFLLLKCCRKTKRKTSLNFMYKRLMLGVLLLIMYAAQKITSTMLSLVQCISLGDKHHLFIHGETECWQIWQTAIMFYILFFIVPICFVFLLGPNLLKDGMISAWQFLVALFLPLLFLSYWIYLIFSKKENQFWQINNKKVSVYNDVILKEVHSSFSSKSLPFHVSWAGIIEFRRLCLVICYVLIQDNSMRILIMFFLILNMLIFHIASNPYENVLLNRMSLASLYGQLFVGFTNMALTMIQVTDVDIVTFPKFTVTILLYIEEILTLWMTSGFVLIYIGFILWPFIKSQLKIIILRS